jgi:hypothetical protein
VRSGGSSERQIGYNQIGPGLAAAGVGVGIAVFLTRRTDAPRRPELQARREVPRPLTPSSLRSSFEADTWGRGEACLQPAAGLNFRSAGSSPSMTSLAAERAYYDRATLLRQLRVFHEPDSAIGRASTMLMHPFTMAQVIMRKIWRQD